MKSLFKYTLLSCLVSMFLLDAAMGQVLRRNAPARTAVAPAQSGVRPTQADYWAAANAVGAGNNAQWQTMKRRFSFASDFVNAGDQVFRHPSDVTAFDNFLRIQSRYSGGRDLVADITTGRELHIPSPQQLRPQIPPATQPPSPPPPVTPTPLPESQSQYFSIKIYYDTDVVSTALTYRGGSAQIFSDGSWNATNVPNDFLSWMRRFEGEGHKIKSVAFTRNGGWVIIYGHNGYRYWNIPSGLVTALRQADARQSKLLSVAIGSQDQWVLLANDYWWSSSNWVSFMRELNQTRRATRVEFDSTSYRLWVIEQNGGTRVVSGNFR